MRILISVLLVFSVAVGAVGEGVARPCVSGCCGAEGACQCGHDSPGGLGGNGGQSGINNNDIPAAPQMPCRASCIGHAAGGAAALGDSEVKVSQKESGKAGAEKPDPHFAPFSFIKGAAVSQPIIRHLNPRRGPPGFEETSTRLALLSTFRN